MSIQSSRPVGATSQRTVRAWIQYSRTWPPGWGWGVPNFSASTASGRAAAGRFRPAAITSALRTSSWVRRLRDFPPSEQMRAVVPTPRNPRRSMRPCMARETVRSVRTHVRTDSATVVERVRRRSGVDRIDEILRATLDVIRRDGLGAVTHRTVAEASGVPLGSITYYFATKQDLLRAALRLFVAEDVARLRATADALVAAGASGPEVVERFAEVLEAQESGGVAQFDLYLEASRDPVLRGAAIESLRAYAEVAELALRAAGVADPEAAATIVVATVDGLGLHRLAAGPDAPEGGPALTRLRLALTARRSTARPRRRP